MNTLTASQKLAMDEQALEAQFGNMLPLADYVTFTPSILEGGLALENGKVRKAQTEDGRRMMIFGTRFGDVVLIEQYALGHGPFALETIVPKQCEPVASPKSVTDLAKLVVLNFEALVERK